MLSTGAIVMLVTATVMGDGGQSVPLRDLRRVEQGVGDRAPGAVSLRQPGAELRVPMDFAGVYRVPAGSSPYAGWYARVAGMGGVVAVFPRGTYSTDKDGRTVADVPAGTRFLLGGIPKGEAWWSGTSAPSDLRVNLGVVTRARPGLEAPSLVVAAPHRGDKGPGLWGGGSVASLTERLFSDEVYRGLRLTALLEAASRSGDAGAPAGADEAGTGGSAR